MKPQQDRRSGPGIFSTDGAAWVAALALGLVLHLHDGAAPLLQWPPDWLDLFGRSLGALAVLKLCWLDVHYHRKR